MTDKRLENVFGSIKGASVYIADKIASVDPTTIDVETLQALGLADANPNRIKAVVHMMRIGSILSRPMTKQDYADAASEARALAVMFEKIAAEEVEK